MPKKPHGLAFTVVDSTVAGVAAGGTVYLDDPVQVAQLVAAGAIEPQGMSRGDLMVILDLGDAVSAFAPKPRKGDA